MLKIGLWLVTPSVVTFFASSYSIQNTLVVLVLAVVVLMMGIGPRLPGKAGS